MDKKLLNTIAWSGRAAMSPERHVTSPSAEQNSVVVDGETFTHAYAFVNGIRLHYLMGGDGKQPVLLVHGFPGSWRNWEPLMGALVRAGFSPIVPDYRGAGETDISVDGYDKKSMAHDLHELITLLNIKQVDIIGHDMGLIIAYAYGALYPLETGRIVLMDGFIPGVPGWELAYNGDAAAGIASKWHFRFFGKAALTLIQGQEKTYLDMFFDDFVFAGNAQVSRKVRQALVQDYSRPGRMEAAFKLYSAWVEHDANDNLEFSKNKLVVPLLTIGGDHSRGKTLAEQALYIATQPHSLILVDTGHWVLEEQTQATREGECQKFCVRA
ncbi:Pimeloyl-ACP methyl ester carboxylesterase [Pseudomonas sp. NFIX10]|uniref:alpha/beta fold hydrolase n=1 Tax=unclassified Pseudomonas TaxID=196821 RepID=UPI0008EA9856|nr:MULTISPECIES: alpha/beta hydrolase [unclassified Pseudomonas]SFB48969.1 Pimeloyl-ACP methyl ester carboxylesterase [Pseudomonas sp. NFIX10]SFF24092.1 Pimeloyl-ACP methyl ester carboxylesterase [Pseudomonas sp. NFACC06-1]